MYFYSNILFLDFRIIEGKNVEELVRYLESGDQIIQATTYANSNMKKVEEFLMNPTAFLDHHRAALKFPERSLRFVKTFVSLAAPSFEGKTQTAFTLRNINPLYFVAAAAAADTEGNIQTIYEAFKEHTEFLHDCALTDIAKLRVPISAEKSIVTATDLKGKYRSNPLFVLGFFLNVMKQYEAKSAESSQPLKWMEFYATGLSSFDCNPISVEQFIEKKRSINVRFCVFLDEFLFDSWSAFVRNLARAVGLTCVVSNTNTNIANLVVKSSSMSRSNGLEEAWCLVFRRLDNVDVNVIFSNPQFRSALELVKEHCVHCESDRALFNKLFGLWLSKSRPGIAISVLNALVIAAEELVKKQRQESIGQQTTSLSVGPLSYNTSLVNLVSTIEGVLRYVSSYIASELSSRKGRMVTRLNGQIAKLGLLTHAAYAESAAPSASDEVYRFIQFIENHLYYLTNPTGANLDFFLTFAPTEDTGNLRLAWLNKDIQTEVEDWSLHLTSFREDELFTFLGCLCIKLSCSPNFILHEASHQRMVANTKISDLENLNAIKLSGNQLEVAAAITCAEASHHSGGTSPSYSFQGQNALTWINNIVANCCLKKNSFREYGCTITQNQANVFDLETWLRSLTIPFLYGINHQNAWLDELSAAPQSLIFARQYFRTADSASIDGCFQFSMLVRGLTELRTCTVECKNYSAKVGAYELDKLVVKAINGRKFDPRTGVQLSQDSRFQPDFFLIFTNEITNPGTNSRLRTTCLDKMINLYCLRSNLNLVPFHDQWTVFEEPKTVGIVIEMDTT